MKRLLPLAMALLLLASPAFASCSANDCDKAEALERAAKVQSGWRDAGLERLSDETLKALGLSPLRHSHVPHDRQRHHRRCRHAR